MRSVSFKISLFIVFSIFYISCMPPETSDKEHKKLTLTWEQVALGCQIMGDGDAAHAMCNHGHSFNFRSSNLFERMKFLKFKGIEDISTAELMATGKSGGKLGLPSPITPLMRAILGEKVRIRVISYGPEHHDIHIHGHVWSDKGTLMDTKSILPAEVYDAVEFYAGGGSATKGKRSGIGDWKYHCHVPQHVPSGMWGIFRVDKNEVLKPKLLKDGRFPYEIPKPLGQDGETIHVYVVAVEATLVVTRTFRGGKLMPVERTLRLYVPFPDKTSWEKATVESAKKIVEAHKETWQPWVLVLRQGVTAKVHLKNLLPDTPVSLHPHGIKYEIDSDGANPVSIVWPGKKSYTYTWHADSPGTWPLHDHARPLENVRRGLFSAIIVKTLKEEKDLDRDYIIFFHDYDMDWFMGRTEPSGAGH